MGEVKNYNIEINVDIYPFIVAEDDMDLYQSQSSDKPNRISQDFIDFLTSNVDKFKRKGKQKTYAEKVASLIFMVLKAQKFYMEVEASLTQRVIFDLMKEYNKPTKNFKLNRNCSTNKQVWELLSEWDFFEKNKKIYRFEFEGKKSQRSQCDWRVNIYKLKDFLKYEGKVYE